MSVFIASTADDLAPLADLGSDGRGNVRLLVLDEAVPPPRREYLETIFRTVIAPSPPVRFLQRHELGEVMSSDHRADLFIGGMPDRADDVVILYRGNLDRMAIPLSWFRRAGKTEGLDLDCFGVTDFGQTVRFGRFEASTDAVLYAFDAEYRRRAKLRQLESDDSFGGALRRLRHLKGLSRSDFAPLSAKAIARIERGEVAWPRGHTLRVIAKMLAVEPEEIATY